MKRTLVACVLWLLAMQVFAGDGLGSGVKDTCKPISCVATFKDYMGHDRSYTRFWQYDTLGRVTIDSINAPDSVWASPLYTEHYKYDGDSTIGTGRYTGTMAINATYNNNLPIICVLPNGAKYRALYTLDGKLEKVIIGRYGLNEKGKQDVFYSTIDSINYFEGNIISYRYSGIVNYKVYFTYLKDSLYKQDFNPTDRILALIGRPDEEPGFLNVQVFSKELLNSEENGYTKTYAYQRDEQGRILGIDRSYNNGMPGAKTTTIHYCFKYSCK